MLKGFTPSLSLGTLEGARLRRVEALSLRGWSAQNGGCSWVASELALGGSCTHHDASQGSLGRRMCFLLLMATQKGELRTSSLSWPQKGWVVSMAGENKSREDTCQKK